jgi:hypothetical protein
MVAITPAPVPSHCASATLGTTADLIWSGKTPNPYCAVRSGHNLPGIAECCELMIKAHKHAMLQQPWLKMIGWDAIVSRTGRSPVLFAKADLWNAGVLWPCWRG